jgi:hypothetical protein
MSNANAAAGWCLQQFVRESINAADRFRRMKRAIAIECRQTRAVVAAILEPAQSLDQKLSRASTTHISHYATHQSHSAGWEEAA